MDGLAAGHRCVVRARGRLRRRRRRGRGGRCGHDGRRDDRPATPEGMLDSLGAAEGQVNLIAWAGYVEDGSTDPNVDWVSEFEEQSGCQVNVKIGNTSDEMVTLMRTGQYDGVSASGDASLRLIAAGDVAPVNLDLIPNYENVFEGLKDQPHNTVDDVAVRRPARPRREPAPVPHRRRQAGAGLMGGRLRRELPLQGQGDRVRQPDLHRRRGRLPEGDAAGARDRGSVRARPGAVRRGGRPAEAAARGDRRVLVGLHEADRGLHRRRERRRDDVAGDHERARGREGPGRRRCCRRRARRAGRTRG